MSSSDEAKTEQFVKGILTAARDQAPTPSPYLKTRVFAELQQRRQDRRLRLWKRWAILSPVLSLALVAAFFVGSRGSSTDYLARVNEKVLVRVEIEQLQNQGVQYAEVELPEGVYFYSEKFPELQDRRSVTLTWNENMGVSHLPVVIRSQQSGSKQVKIRFLNGENQPLGERKVTIRFSA